MLTSCSFFKKVCEKMAETSSADSPLLIAAFLVGRVLPSALQDPHRFGLLKGIVLQSTNIFHCIYKF
jgi:hypothetical protein